MDCKLFDAALAALTELLSVLPMEDPGWSDLSRKFAEAKAKLGIGNPQAEEEEASP